MEKSTNVRCSKAGNRETTNKYNTKLNTSIPEIE